MREHKYRALGASGWVYYTIGVDSIERRDGVVYFNGIRVEKGTLCQYTGEKDSKGVEIYEGDIVFYEPFETHNNDRVIRFNRGIFEGVLIRNGYGIPLSEVYLPHNRVIGNIFQNPELFFDFPGWDRVDKAEYFLGKK